MADNIIVLNGAYSGTIATKDIGGAHYQKVVLVDSAGSIVSGVAQIVNQGTAGSGSAAWPMAITNTADTIVKPGDAVNNAMRVNVVTGVPSLADDAAFTPGTTPISPIGGLYQSVRDSVDDNDGGVLAMTAKRALLATIETPNGDSAMDEANDAMRVNIVAGAGAGGTATQDDTAFTVGTTTMTPVGGTYRSVRDLVDDNDAGAFAMTARRALYATLEDPDGDSVIDATLNSVKVSGVQANVTTTGYNATTSSTEALASNANRRGVMVQNLSDTRVFMAFNAAPVATFGSEVGIALEPNGGSIFLGQSVDTRAINVIHAGVGDKRLVLTEW